jgi:hypothetical protein
MDKGIDKHFKKRFNGILQFVSEYNDFEKVEKGDLLGILAQGRGNEFGAYFEGRELKRKFQKVFLQQECIINDGPQINQKFSKVVEYKLPLTGKICLEHFIKGKIKEYPLN